MYKLLAEKDDEGDDCPECEEGTMLHTVYITDRRVQDFMKEDKQYYPFMEEEDEQSWIFNILPDSKYVDNAP